MSSIRKNKVEKVIQEEVSMALQQNTTEFCLGSMVTVTVVRVTADLSYAKIYLSIFAGSSSREEVLKNIQNHKGKIRGLVGKRLKNMRKIPDLSFYIDDSLDYAEKINELLKK